MLNFLMGRKRRNHQIYSSPEDRLRWAASLPLKLTHLMAENKMGLRSSAFLTSEILQIYCEDLKIVRAGPRSRENQLASGEKSSFAFSNSFLGTRWKGIPERIQEALEKWEAGLWPIELYFRPLEPLEVLQQLEAGKRGLSILHTAEDLASLVEEKFDALGFIIHDLMHAYQFFHDPASNQGQRKFARALLTWLNELRIQRPDSWTILMKDEAFNYLMSDMNSHPTHLKQTLQHICYQLNISSLFISFSKHWIPMTEIVPSSENITINGSILCL